MVASEAQAVYGGTSKNRPWDDRPRCLICPSATAVKIRTATFYFFRKVVNDEGMAQDLQRISGSHCSIRIFSFYGGGKMNTIIDWIKENKTIVLAIVVCVLVVVAIVVLIAIFYEPPLEVGTIVNIQSTTDRVKYSQHEDSIYRYVTKYRWVTKTDSSGKQYQEQESYREREFDHYEYYITREFNGADYLVTIEAPSENNHQKIRSATIYITKERYENIKNLVGQTFVFSEAMGDRRRDFNNSYDEVDRKSYTRFDLIEWMSAHNVQDTP